jgi:uncharacterized protein YqhQ
MMAAFYYGGQAVIEGVMMRGRHQATVVVRKPDGDLLPRTELLPDALYRHRVARLPLVRGLVMLWEMMILGTRLMIFSANVQARGKMDREIPRRLMVSMMTVSLIFAVGIFFVLPLLLTRAGQHLFSGSLAANAIEGAVRLAFFVGYLILMGRLDQMYRVFQYHGAEHKTINAFEHGAPLVPSEVQRFSLTHTRCGTAFLLWVIVVSIFVFGLMGHPPILLAVAARIVLVPIIAAISYEILRLGARFYHITPVRLILQPGLWLQHLTTREPSDDQVAVAIAALIPVLNADGVPYMSGHDLSNLAPIRSEFVAG